MGLWGCGVLGFRVPAVGDGKAAATRKFGIPPHPPPPPEVKKGILGPAELPCSDSYFNLGLPVVPLFPVLCGFRGFRV